MIFGLVLLAFSSAAWSSSELEGVDESVSENYDFRPSDDLIDAHGVPDYLIRAGDKVDIKVYREEELSGVFVVDPYGKINYPLLGELILENVSVEEVRKYLTNSLGRAYVKNPQVQVKLLESRSKSVSFLGRVVSPGDHILSPNTTLVNLISKVGGFASDADQEHIRLIRTQPDGSKSFVTANIGKIIKGEEEDVLLSPGDVIFVDPVSQASKTEEYLNEVITILGQVARPGNYPSRQNPTLVRLVGNAGGFTPVASKNRIKILRNENGNKKVFYVNFNQIIDGAVDSVELGAGDIVQVPESMF